MASPTCVEGNVKIKLARDKEDGSATRWLTSNPMRHLFEQHDILSELQKQRMEKNQLLKKNNI